MDLKKQLKQAIYDGNEEKVKTLIASHGFSHTVDGGYSLLVQALRNDDFTIAKVLVTSSVQVNDKALQQEPHDTPLYLAVGCQQMDIVEMLLDKGADMGAVSYSGLTPLGKAINTGNLEFLELLLNRGFDLNARGPGGLRPLHVAAKEGKEDAVLFLLSYGADIDASSTDNKTALCYAAEEAHVEVVKLLLQFRPDVNNESNKQALYGVVQSDVDTRFLFELDSEDDDGSKHPPLPFYTAFEGDVWKEVSESKKLIFGILLDYGFIYELEPGSDTKFFHGAIELGFSEIVEDLLMYGADANMGFCGQTPLLLAIKTNQPDITKLLIFYGADVNAQDSEKKTPMYYAAESGNAKLSKILLKHGATVSDSAEVMHAAISARSLKIVKQLLNHVEINDFAHEGTTALCVAVQKECRDITWLLLNKGADVNAICEKGQVTALHFAAGNHSATKFFEDKKNWTPLISSRPVGIFHMLLQAGADVHSRDARGKTPLHWASCAETAETLLQYGADVNARDHKGKTPLLTVSSSWLGDGIIEALVRFGADVDSQDKKGKTALHLASKDLDNSVIRLLLNVGADINICDKKNRTALDIALTASLERNPTHFSRRNSLVKFLHFYWWHIFRMQAINRFASEDNVQKMQEAREMVSFTEADFRGLRESCEKEVAKLVVKKIKKSNVSYYAFLVKKISSLAVLLRNENIVKAFRSNAVNDEEFPAYAPLLKSQFRKAMERKGLVEQAYQMFGILCGEMPHLPAGCVEEILQYLSNKDLHVLIAAGKAPLQCSTVIESKTLSEGEVSTDSSESSCHSSDDDWSSDD